MSRSLRLGCWQAAWYPRDHTELSPAAAWPTSTTPVRRSTRSLRSSTSTRGPRRQACCRPTEGSGRRRRDRSPGPVARAHGGSGGHDDRATAVPTGRQCSSGRFGVLPCHLAAAAGRAHLDPPVHRPVPPFGVRMCRPRWDVGQRGAHARQRPLRRRERQRFLHHSRGWPLLSHRGERPSHLPAGANLRTRASGTTRSPTAELPLDVAGNHLPAAAACTTVDDA
jgi:hypothetical protein